MRALVNTFGGFLLGVCLLMPVLVGAEVFRGDPAPVELSADVARTGVANTFMLPQAFNLGATASTLATTGNLTVGGDLALTRVGVINQMPYSQSHHANDWAASAGFTWVRDVIPGYDRMTSPASDWDSSAGSVRPFYSTPVGPAAWGGMMRAESGTAAMRMLTVCGNGNLTTCTCGTSAGVGVGCTAQLHSPGGWNYCRVTVALTTTPTLAWSNVAGCTSAPTLAVMGGDSAGGSFLLGDTFFVNPTTSGIGLCTNAGATTATCPGGGITVPGAITSTVPSGSNALVLQTGANICLEPTCVARLYTIGTALYSGGGVTTGFLTATSSLDARSSIINNGANHGGSIPFGEATRWTNATTALLESSTAATAGTDNAFTLNVLADLTDNTDRAVLVQENGVDKMAITSNGVVAAASFSSLNNPANNVQLGLIGGGFGIDNVSSATFTHRARAPDGASAVAHRLYNSTSLVTAGARMLTLDNNGTVVAAFDKDGMPQIGIGNAAAPPTCDASQRGKLWYAGGAAGVADTAAICTKDAADAFAWRSLY